MGLGRITRFAKTPPGSRRVGVMRRGSTGIKVLAPSDSLLNDFERRKTSLIDQGVDRTEAHALAADRCDYRHRFRSEIHSRPDALVALRGLIKEARTADLYLMCMCPYDTVDRACHTYLLLDLAREIEPSLVIIDEPRP
jgi:hypothetical protein